MRPTSQPSNRPVLSPTNKPVNLPSSQPLNYPSHQPGSRPSISPSRQPRSSPTRQPSRQPVRKPTLQPYRKPTRHPKKAVTPAPTLQPSSSPTSQPSRQPKIYPINSPSSQPTAVPKSSLPTSKPTRSPIKRVATMRPTIQNTPTATINAPSNLPSVNPTLNSNYQLSPLFSSYQKLLSTTNDNSSVSFLNFYYNGKYTFGNCNSWQSYITNSLVQPSDAAYFSKIDFTYFISKNGYVANITATCSDVAIISSLIANLRNGLKYSATCNGNVWNVFQCSGQPIFCVNCKTVCTQSVLCPGESFAVTPCNTPCVEHGSAVSAIVVQSTERILYPIIQSPLLIAPNVSSAQVLINATKQGTAYCAAFSNSIPPQSLWDIFSQGFSSQIISKSTITSVTVANLYPDTLYSIMCYTADFYGHTMPFSTATKMAVTIRTLCCRKIISPTSPAVILAVGSTASTIVPQFYIGLNSPPADSVTLNFKIYPIACGSKRLSANLVSNLVSISPSSVTYDQFSYSVVSGFFVSSTVPGCYLLQILTSGGTTYTPLNTTFRVQSSSVPPSAPTLSKVQMSDDGSRLNTYFSSDTNQAGPDPSSTSKTFTCSNVLDFVGARNSSCFWSAPSSLIAYLSSTVQQPILGTSLNLKANTVKAACVSGQNCAAYVSSNAQSTKITAPVNPLKPLFSISSARAISSCDDMYLDVTSAQGSGGRPWVRVLWNITGKPANALNQKKLTGRFQTLNSFLNKQYTQVDKVVQVPNKYLNASVTYTVSLTLVNFLQQPSTASVVISVDSSSGAPPFPQVRVYGSNGQLLRWMEITFYASVSLPPCFSGSGNTSYSYSWSLYSNSRYLSTIQSSSPLSRLFTLPPYTLSASAPYTLLSTVTVATSSSSGSKVSTMGSNSITFNVGQSGIRAQISGGNQQYLSPTDPVVFDASSSYDIDYPTENNLLFLWSCVQTYPMYGLPCNLCKSNITQSILTVQCALPPGVYNVSVLVSNTENVKVSTFALVTISNYSIPKTFINNVQMKYNPSDNVLLSGTVTASKSCLAQWISPDIPNSQLSKISLTQLSRTLLSGTSVFQVAIAANSLSGGVAYTFQLQASYNARQISIVSVTITMNRPPSGGSLSITPSIGFAFNTTYTLSTFSWTDDVGDLPLRYLFSYYSIDPRTEKNILKSLDLVPSVSTFLGQGLSSLGYSLGCLVFAVDIYSGQANTSTTVVVQPMKSTSNLLTTMNAALSNAFAQQNIYGVTQVVNTVLSSLNGVDCAVPVPCRQLSRKICMSTAKTCGPCLDGFVGITGDSNVACRPTAKLNRTGEYCSSNSSCISGVCLKNPPRCADISKSCPNDCGGRSSGACAYKSIYGSIVSSCSVSNPFCHAECSCLPGKFGRDCSLSTTALSQYQALRSSICSTLLKNMGKQSVTVDVVASRAFTIGNVFSDITQITSSALLNCTYVLTTTIKNHLDLVCSDNTASVVLQALSNVVLVGNRLPPNLFTDVVQSTNSLLSSCQSSMAIGQVPQSSNTANIKALSYVSDRDSGNVGCDGVKSELETFLNVPATAMCANMSTSGVAAGFSVIQYLLDPQIRASTSSSLNIQITPVSYNSNSNRRALQSSDTGISLTLTFQNIEEISYDNIPTKNLTLFCNGKVSNRLLSCPSGLVVNATCPIGKIGIRTVVCPAHQVLPQCTYWNGTQFIRNPLCSVVEYTAYNTTCKCANSIPTGDDVQTLKLSAGSLVREGTPIQVFTLSSKAPITHDAVVHITMGTLALLFLGFVLFSRFYNSTDARKISAFSGRQPASFYKRMDSFFEDLLPADLVKHSWITTMVSQIQEKHLFGVFERPREMFPKWFDFLCRTIIVFFMDVVVAAIFFGDDGSCSELTRQMECDSFRNFIPTVNFHVCSWQSYDQTCQYNDDFGTPSLLLASTLSVLILASLPFSYVSAVLEVVNHVASAGKTQKVIIPHVLPIGNQLSKRSDENTSLRKVCQRAAGFILAKRRIDNTAVNEEAYMIYGILDSLRDDRRSPRARARAKQSEPIKYYDLPIQMESLREQVQKSRDDTELLVSELDKIASLDLKEKYLMQKFLLEFMSADSKRVAERYMLSAFPPREIAEMSWRRSLVVVALLIMVLAAMAYVTDLLSRKIGSLSSLRWLGIGLIAIAVDVAVIQLVAIWLHWVVFVSFFKSEITQLYNRLRDRSRLILMRSFGVIQSYKWLTQHLSPACRVSRANSVSVLPVSRLLRAINDFDLPPDVRYNWAISPARYFLQAMDRCCSLFINSTLMLPLNLNNFAIYIYALVIAYGLGISLTLLGVYTMWVYPVIVVAGAVIVIIVIAIMPSPKRTQQSQFVITERMAVYQTQAVAIASALAMADDDLLDSERNESKEVHSKPAFSPLPPLSPLSPFSPSSRTKPAEYLSNVIVRQSKRHQQLQFPSPEKLPDYIDFLLPSEAVNQPTTTQDPSDKNDDIVVDFSSGQYWPSRSDTKPVSAIKEPAVHVEEPAIKERNALASSIEKALLQVQAQSSRQRSSMQRTRRYTSSEPWTVDSHPNTERQSLDEHHVSTTSSLLDGVALYQATTSGTRKLVNSPTKPAASNGLLGPSRRAHLLMSDDHPLVPGGASSLSLPSEIRLPPLLEHRLDSIGSTAAAIDGSVIEQGPSFTTPRPAAAGKKKKRRHAGPGSQLYDT